MQKKAKRPIIFLCANLLISYSIQSLAEEWSSITKKDGYEIFVDIDSYNQENGWPYMTAKIVYKTPQMVRINTKPMRYITQISQWQFNCKNPVYRTRFSTFYDPKNQAIGKGVPMKDFQTIPAKSAIFSVGQLTCQVHQMVGGQ